MSQFNVFFLPHGDDGSAADVLNSFLRSHRILQVERRATDAGWGFCVEWTDAKPGEPPRGLRFSEKIDYMKELPPEVFAVFSKLRARRKAIAADSGLAPFAICSDAQLAEIARMENPTVADLRKVEGLGEARVRNFGEKLLDALAPANSEKDQPAGDPS